MQLFEMKNSALIGLHGRIIAIESSFDPTELPHSIRTNNESNSTVLMNYTDWFPFHGKFSFDNPKNR